MKGNKSLKTILMVNFMLAAILPMLLVGGVTLWLLFQSQEADVKNKNLILARSLAGEVDRFLGEPLGLLAQISDLLQDERILSPSEINPYLDTVLANYPFFNRIEVLNRRGVVEYLSPFRLDHLGLDMSAQPFFRISQQRRKVYWSPCFNSAQTGQPTLTLSYPMNSKTVVGYLDLAALQAIIARVKLGKSGYAAIADQQGTVIAHPHGEWVSQQWNVKNLKLFEMGLKGRDETGRYRFQGVEKLGSVARLSRTGWVVAVIQPVKEAFAPVRKVRNLTLLGFVTAVIVAMLVAMWSLSKTLRPLAALNAYTRDIARDNPSPPPEPASGYQEVAELSKRLWEAIQEKKALQERLARSQKMQALGLLAGGVAHDLNNILAGIVSYPELVLLKLPPDSSLKKPLLRIQEAGQRAAAVVSDLLTATRGVANNKQPLDLNTVIADYLNSPEYADIRSRYPEVRIQPAMDPDIQPIEAAPFHVEKSLMNLVINAAEALNSGGTIRIRTCRRELAAPCQSYEEIPAGRYTVLSVSDNGPGIAPEDVERIFEPFYTKKVMGRSGTGLGLTVVWNTVKENSGYMDVRTGAGGTRFDLYFPAVDGPAVEKKQPPADSALFQGSSEPILVVDDQAPQRELACESLRYLGYQAHAVESGEAAVKYLKNSAADLVILDMIMEPGMDGLETYAQILKFAPAQKAIIVSGYADADRVEAAYRLGVAAFLPKPYTLEQISQAIRKALAAGQGRSPHPSSDRFSPPSTA